MRELIAEAPLAWVPIGPLEWHGEHLPLGVDYFTARGFCLAAAELAGGVVLPSTYLASGVLSFDYGLTFELDLVCRAMTATVAELARNGFRVVVVHVGHGPLDLIHALKRTAAELERAHPGLRVYAFCWLELNAALLEGRQIGEPVVGDHAARVETSYMLHLEPELVALERLPDDPDARPVGVYGRNPRFTASLEFGKRSFENAAALLAERARALLRGEDFDRLADVRRFVELCWPEPMLLGARGGELELTNPGTSSRYLTSLALSIDGAPVLAGEIELANDNPGEGATALAASLGPESGFYVRRDQTARLRLPAPLPPGEHRVEATIGLGGVSAARLEAVVAVHDG